jgi:hypothetical protein
MSLNKGTPERKMAREQTAKRGAHYTVDQTSNGTVLTLPAYRCRALSYIHHSSIDISKIVSVKFAALAHPPQRTSHHTHGARRAANPQNEDCERVAANAAGQTLSRLRVCEQIPPAYLWCTHRRTPCGCQAQVALQVPTRRSFVMS